MNYKKTDAKVLVNDLIKVWGDDLGIVLNDFDSNTHSLYAPDDWSDSGVGVRIYTRSVGLISYDEESDTIELLERDTDRLDLFPGLFNMLRAAGRKI